MVFRTATMDDCEAVYRLICDMEAKALPCAPFAEIFRAQRGDDRYECVVCEDGQTVTGFVNLRYEAQLHHAAPIAEILEFVVDAEHRGRGVGKAILAEACRRAAARGCVQIEVDCNKLRADAHRFYEREGMRGFHFKFSKRLDSDDGGENALGR